MQGSGPTTRRDRAKAPHPRIDRAIAELASRQHGLVTFEQLRGIGLSASAIDGRVRAGRLHRVYRGVFAVGHPLLTRSGYFMAAVLACGVRAALSHRSGACHRGLRPDNRATIDVTSPQRTGRKLAGITVHGGATLLDRDVEIVDGIRTTSLARTLLDLAEVISPRQLERTVEQAVILRELDMRAVDDVLARANGRHGAATLRAVLDVIRPGTTNTRNDLEEAFLRICRDADTPPDGVNQWIPYPEGGGAEADFIWREPRLIAEVDGRATHLTPQAFEHDRARDQRLSTLGWRVVRFSFRQVEADPAGVAATVAALLHAAQTP
jgi:predicted transcriptional regulator of viral defense system